MKSGKNRQIILKRDALSLYDFLSRFGGLNSASRAVQLVVSEPSSPPLGSHTVGLHDHADRASFARSRTVMKIRNRESQFG
jgi:hypothetical protein